MPGSIFQKNGQRVGSEASVLAFLVAWLSIHITLYLHSQAVWANVFFIACSFLGRSRYLHRADYLEGAFFLNTTA